MRVLVTGGAGFIGSAFVRWTLRHHPEVHVTTYDALTYAGRRENLDGIDGRRHTFVHGDVRDRDGVLAAMEGVDAVVHFAAESHVDRSIDGPVPFLDTNVTGTGVVLEAARRLEVGRTLHVSTDEVYGSISEGSFTETDPLLPNSPYAASKAGADLLARSFHATYGLPVVVTRACNTFGPRQYPEKLVPLFVTTLLQGGTVPVYGDGSNVRDWLHVDDNAAAQWAVLWHGTPGTAYNIGAGNETTNLDVARRLVALCGADGERIEHVTDRPGHDQRYSVDASRLRTLGWAPMRRLDDGLEETVEWYRSNEAWWRPLLDAGATQRRGR